MLVTSVVAPMFATNCWILADKAGGECILVDPGMPEITNKNAPVSLAPEIEMEIERFDLKPVAALLTHGHLDHTFSIQPLADGYDIPTYIHSQDAQFVAMPAGLHGIEFSEMIAGLSFKEPRHLTPIRDGFTFNALGMTIRAVHAPGHTRGSAMFLVDEETLISGDVLFAGSIGRTDLPTGSMTDMKATLQNKILPLADDIRVLPGHGSETTIKYERKNNPYLKEFAL